LSFSRITGEYAENAYLPGDIGELTEQSRLCPPPRNKIPFNALIWCVINTTDKT
jgi:hypothetical protein